MHNNTWAWIKSTAKHQYMQTHTHPKNQHTCMYAYMWAFTTIRFVCTFPMLSLGVVDAAAVVADSADVVIVAVYWALLYGVFFFIRFSSSQFFMSDLRCAVAHNCTTQIVQAHAHIHMRMGLCECMNGIQYIHGQYNSVVQTSLQPLKKWQENIEPIPACDAFGMDGYSTQNRYMYSKHTHRHTHAHIHLNYSCFRALVRRDICLNWQ